MRYQKCINDPSCFKKRKRKKEKKIIQHFSNLKKGTQFVTIHKANLRYPYLGM